MTSRIGVLTAVVLLAWTAASCRYSEAKEPGLEHTKAEPSPSKPDEAMVPASSDGATQSGAAAGESCDDETCVGSEDCCKGYACGFDPERSKVQRYCQRQ